MEHRAEAQGRLALARLASVPCKGASNVTGIKVEFLPRLENLVLQLRRSKGCSHSEVVNLRVRHLSTVALEPLYHSGTNVLVLVPGTHVL